MTSTTTEKKSVYQEAADALRHAKFLLVAVGAGFSKDSGLSTYNEIANVPLYKQLKLTYADLACPEIMEDKFDLFHGFWANCFNSYRNTKEHKGYEILQILKEKIFSNAALQQNNESIYQTFTNKQKEVLEENGIDSSKIAGPLFIYSSNVDAHFHRKFEQNEIYEIHGNTEEWQCSEQCKGQSSTWSFDPSFRFDVDEVEMVVMKSSEEMAMSLKCRHCQKAWARPRVMLFGDSHFVHHEEHELRYVAWEAAVERAILVHGSEKEDPEYNQFVILEMGCGTRVPSIREEVAQVMRDTNGKTTLIRINPTESEIDNLGASASAAQQFKKVSIPDSSLAALEKISSLLAIQPKNPNAEALNAEN